MKITRKNLSLEIAFVLAVIVYFILYVLFSLISLDSKHTTSEQIVFIDYKSFEKNNIKNLDIIEKHITQQSVKKITKRKKISLKNLPILQKFVQINSNLIEKLDSLAHYSNSVDSTKTMNEFILENPNLISLKIALNENIKNGVIKVSKKEITEKRIKKAMFDYYKAKYPTPPYKFGELGTGNLINIPIDSLVEFFK
jgi:hypothetical protein